MQMYRNYPLKVPTKVRKEIQEKTGLTAQQLNKWIHDQKMRETKDLIDRFGIRPSQAILFTVIKDDKCIQPIFKLERCKENIIKMTGKPEVL